ncbi:MAG: DUF1924 domain-containing protein [Methylotenera sp.]
MKHLNIVLATLLGLAAFSAQADVASAQKLADKYTAIAKSVNADFTGPSAADGKFFFNRKIKLASGKETSCSSCHTSNPASEGKNIVTGKSIAPLSPVVNFKRFSDIDKVEDLFTQHCNDIIGSDCTAAEKANYITYLLTEKTPSSKK